MRYIFIGYRVSVICNTNKIVEHIFDIVININRRWCVCKRTPHNNVRVYWRFLNGHSLLNYTGRIVSRY